MYEKDYIKAIKYSKNEDVFQNLEGHQLHANNPILYPDWLRDHDKHAMADFIEEARNNGEAYNKFRYNDTIYSQNHTRQLEVSPKRQEFTDKRIELSKENKPFITTFSNGYGRHEINLFHPSKSENKYHMYFHTVVGDEAKNKIVEDLKNEGIEHLEEPHFHE